MIDEIDFIKLQCLRFERDIVKRMKREIGSDDISAKVVRIVM